MLRGIRPLLVCPVKLRRPGTMWLPQNGSSMQPLRIRYQTIEFGEFDIHVRTLRDNQQFSDPDGEAERLGISSALWPLFGVIWKSGEYLAHLMDDYPIKGKRILEVGCGIGLASIVLNHRGADITATDYHPEVESFLKENTLINNDPDISFVRTAWDDKVCLSLGLFDLIIGSDLLYEEEHAKLLASFINQHSRSQCMVVIVDPGRGHSAEFIRHMTDFGFHVSQEKHQLNIRDSEPFTARILGLNR